MTLARREYWRERDQNRRARMAGNGGTFSTAEWRELVERYGGRCAYCGEQPERLHIEHRVPISRGGANSAENIVPACEPCNSSKGAKTDIEYLGSRPINTPESLKMRKHRGKSKL